MFFAKDRMILRLYRHVFAKDRMILRLNRDVFAKDRMILRLNRGNLVETKPKVFSQEVIMTLQEAKASFQSVKRTIFYVIISL